MRDLFIVLIVAPIAIPLGAGMAIGLFWAAMRVSGAIAGI